MSDMDALKELISRVETGWRVSTTNHDSITESREGTVMSVFTAKDQTYRHGEETHWISKGGPAIRIGLDKPRKSQGRTFPESHFVWPHEGDDFVVEGNTLHVYRPAKPHIGKVRVIALTLAFQPPVS